MTVYQERLEAAISFARLAGKLLLGYYKAATLVQNIKPDHSVVTEADIAADTLIASFIHKSFPGDSILSEEISPHQSRINPSPGDFLWIIDPLDGTTNFSLGFPIWGVSIACLHQGKPRIGALYFPVFEELYHAQKDEGAFINGKPIHLDQNQTPLPVSFFSCCSRTHKEYKVTVPYKTRIIGSACYSLCCVAKGSAILGFEATPKVWDLAAGWLMVQESGGVIETLDGCSPFPISAGVDYATTSFAVIAASSPKVVAKARQQIIPIKK